MDENQACLSQREYPEYICVDIGEYLERFEQFQVQDKNFKLSRSFILNV